jgi:crotonobetainyl-CoA:carnitine CoA-transferase CaiB-like acyl-CoA transferase
MLLEGLKVVEMSTWVAGPSAAAVLADWGADVIKVESPIGDATRIYHQDTAENPGNPVFTNENRGKKGVVLDLARPGGKEALKTLLRDADIFITNVRPGSLRRQGLDYESLKGEMPKLIYAAVTGYGLTGPEADVPAFDITAFWTRSGVARAMIPSDQTPFPSRPGFGDHVTALAAVSGILAAVHERHATGRGRLVETSLIRAGAYAISWDLGIQLRNGDVVTARPREERPVAHSGFFRTKDDRWVCLLPRTLDDFTNLLLALDRPELVADERFEPPITDPAAVAELRDICDAAFREFTLDEICGRLKELDLAHAPLGTLAELTEAPYAQEAGCFQEVEDGWGGTFRTTAAPARFPEGAPPVGRAAPKLGQHTREVLLAAGLAPSQVDELLQSGAALQGSQ